MPLPTLRRGHKFEGGGVYSDYDNQYEKILVTSLMFHGIHSKAHQVI